MKFYSQISDNFLCPQGLALSGNRIVVADTGHHQIVEIDISAMPYTTICRVGFPGTTPGVEGFLFPRTLCFLNNSQIVVADTQNKHIDIYTIVSNNWSFSKSIHNFLGVSPPGYIVDIISERSSSVIVLDESNKRLIEVDIATGNSAILFTNLNWKRPIGLKRGGGYTWVVDSEENCVYRYDSNWNETRIGSFGIDEGYLTRPLGVEVDPALNKLYVSEGDIGRISVFDLNGGFIECQYLPSGMAHEPHCMSIDGNGLLWVADSGANVVVAFDTRVEGPYLEISPRQLSFGAVGIGYSLPLPVALFNNGDLDLIINGISVNGNGFSIPDPFNYPITVTPCNRLKFNVVFSPIVQGPSDGTIQIQTQNSQVHLQQYFMYGIGTIVDPMALFLVLDRSGSMNELVSMGMSKIEKLRQAVELLVGLFSQRPNDLISVATFSSTATLDYPLARLSPVLIQVLNQIQASGTTSIGAGLQTALLDMSNSELEKKIAIVLTDGQENTAPFVNSASVQNAINQSNSRIFSVGFGLPENMNSEMLSGLASTNQGYFQITDDRYYLLPKFFINIFSDATGFELALDPVLSFNKMEEQTVPVWIASNEKLMIVVAYWENKKMRLNVDFETPEGKSVGIGDRKILQTTDNHIIFQVATMKAGEWKIHLKPTMPLEEQQQVVVSVLVDSPNRVELTVTLEDENEPSVLPSSSGYDIPPINLDNCKNTKPAATTARKGAEARFAIHFASQSSSAKIVKGQLRCKPPRFSLQSLKKRVRERDTDASPLPTTRPNQLFPVTNSITVRILLIVLFCVVLASNWFLSTWMSLAVIILILLLFISVLRIRAKSRETVSKFNIKHNTAYVKVPLAGFDGIYEMEAKIVGELHDGTRFQREFSRNIVAN